VESKNRKDLVLAKKPAFVTVRKMYFEGSEKKFEIVVRGSALRERPDSYWQNLVEMAGAKILSKISSSSCDAFLLSESSLFVWNDRITMITCGRTNLVRAAMRVLDDVEKENVEFLTYERKNEYYPHRQETDFHKDVELLQSRVPGKAFRFGSPDEHNIFLFHLDRSYRPPNADTTLEILMYNLQGQASEIFNCNQTIERVRQLTRVDQIFPGFKVDDHLFHPCGYSLNAVKESEYYTIHVTPEETGSYVSFETNVRLGNRVAQALRSVVEIFAPRSFDVVYFHPEKELKAFEISPFIQRAYVRESLTCGFEVGFSTYYLKFNEPLAAVALERE
jgi:S-adenosylmethionine decarboxylase